MDRQRVQEQPAYLLHQRAFRDSSQIIDVLSQNYGRLSLVARGSRSAKSRYRGVLRPFHPLSISWTIKSDMGTLTGAESVGKLRPLQGENLMAGFYLSELLLRLLHRHDPQPEVFGAYDQALSQLADAPEVAPVLRRFEMRLLQLLGYGLNLDCDSYTQQPLSPDHYYEYRLEQGPIEVDHKDGAYVFSGAEILGVAEERFEQPDVLRCAGRLMRQVIDFHLEGKELNSRKVLKEMRRTTQVPQAD